MRSAFILKDSGGTRDGPEQTMRVTELVPV